MFIFRITHLNNWMRFNLFLFLFFMSCPFFIKAQTNTYTQLYNELQFARSINDKWAGEIFVGGTFSNTPTESRVLKTNIQRYINVWAHYYLSPRWKLSAAFSYYYNKNVPDMGQYYSPEYRISLQGIYYFHKTGFTLLTRMRGDIRFIMNEDSVFKNSYRYRQMVKYVQPLNGKVLRKGVVYFFATEELLFKPQAKTEGVTFFDRNRFQIGGGYLITDNIQVELNYLNEFIPRDDVNEMYNGLELTITFNNLFTNLKKSIFPKKPVSDPEL